MKRHIATWWLDKLSEEGKERLRGWWEPFVGDNILCEECSWACANSFPKLTKNYVSQLVVGKGECSGCGQKLKDCGKYSEKSKQDHLPLLSVAQMIEFLKDNGKRHTWEIYLDQDNVVDDLWEAVKDVLEE